MISAATVEKGQAGALNKKHRMEDLVIVVPENVLRGVRTFPNLRNEKITLVGKEEKNYCVTKQVRLRVAPSSR